jgi:hypothetical protein
MRTIYKIVLGLAIVGLWLAGCGGSDVPGLAAPDEPTLVYIYTEP